MSKLLLGEIEIECVGSGDSFVLRYLWVLFICRYLGQGERVMLNASSCD